LAGYVNISYSDTAANYICNGTFKVGWARGTASTPTVAPVANGTGSFVTGCDPNNSFWSVGTRTQWNPNSNLDLGVDFGWSQFNTSNSGTYVSAISYGGRPLGLYNVSNYGIFNTAIRAQYNFLP
jgi:hypothetical protein